MLNHTPSQTLSTSAAGDRSQGVEDSRGQVSAAGRESALICVHPWSFSLCLGVFVVRLRFRPLAVLLFAAAAPTLRSVEVLQTRFLDSLRSLGMTRSSTAESRPCGLLVTSSVTPRLPRLQAPDRGRKWRCDGTRRACRRARRRSPRQALARRYPAQPGGPRSHHSPSRFDTPA